MPTIPLEQRLLDLITRTTTEFKTIRSETGALANLTTAQKGSLVAAINELKTLVDSASGINDAAPSTTTSYSSSKTDQQIQAAINALKGDAPLALDTLKELGDLLSSSDTDTDTALAAVLAALDVRLRFDAAQALTAEQQLQARTNIGAVSAAALGNTERDLVEDFNLALL
ncbi:hypothetical protein [Deinococcus sp. QL22]|uniref:hypothetical protein n=1 Tax=Deinococcus sp. QL22 TaxID=2939437 RepID=UPI002016C303|nr:hypothetical protein [Deinococcus sp. QL22]UQN06271.1 hypothetical protein M1R55_15645 [Deinococcus sp. QL22]